MHIIITDAWLAKSRALHLNGIRLVAMGAFASLLMMLGAVAAYHWVFLEGVRQGWPGFGSVARLVTQGELDSKELYMRENLDAMARKLGELSEQARTGKLPPAARARSRWITKPSAPCMRPVTTTAVSCRRASICLYGVCLYRICKSNAAINTLYSNVNH